MLFLGCEPCNECPDRKTDGIKPCPSNPCEYCTGNSAVRKKDGTLMTSWEWCQSVNACAATIDWERVYGR